MVEGPPVRGSPFLQTIFVLVAFALAGVPVWRLTRRASPDPAAIVSNLDTPAAATAPLEVEAVFAPAPTDFQIRNLDQTMLAGQGPRARFTASWKTTVPPEGVDLVVQAHWPASNAGDATIGGAVPAAARVTVRFPDGHQVEKSFWAAANGALAEVFTLPGPAQADAR